MVTCCRRLKRRSSSEDEPFLRREFGRDLTFWGGGCDTQGLLASGTPEQVRDDVRRRLKIFMPGGGTCGTRCTTSWPMCRRKMSSPCWKRPTSSVATK